MRKAYKISLLFVLILAFALFASCSFGGSAQGGLNGGSINGTSDNSSGSVADTPDDNNGDSVQNGVGGGSSVPGSSSTSDTASQGGDFQDVVLTLVVEGGLISWTDVGAEVYKLFVGDKEFTTTETEFTPDGISYGVHIITVKAYLSLEPVVSVVGVAEYVVRPTPPVITLVDGVISWDEFDGAIGYAIYLNDAFIAQKADNCYLPEEDGYYSVCALFEDERLNTARSNAVVVGDVKLTAPVVELVGNMLKWTQSVGAELYYIYFDGVLKVVVSAEGETCEYDLTEWSNNPEDYPEGFTITVVAYSTVYGESDASNGVKFCV